MAKKVLLLAGLSVIAIVTILIAIRSYREQAISASVAKIAAQIYVVGEHGVQGIDQLPIDQISRARRLAERMRLVQREYDVLVSRLEADLETVPTEFGHRNTARLDGLSQLYKLRLSFFGLSFETTGSDKLLDLVPFRYLVELGFGGKIENKIYWFHDLPVQMQLREWAGIIDLVIATTDSPVLRNKLIESFLYHNWSPIQIRLIVDELLFGLLFLAVCLFGIRFCMERPKQT